MIFPDFSSLFDFSLTGKCLPIFQGFPVRVGTRGAPLYGPKYSQFQAVFQKIWQNHMLATPWRVGAPSYGESWIRPWEPFTYLPDPYDMTVPRVDRSSTCSLPQDSSLTGSGHGTSVGSSVVQYVDCSLMIFSSFSVKYKV